MGIKQLSNPAVWITLPGEDFRAEDFEPVSDREIGAPDPHRTGLDASAIHDLLDEVREAATLPYYTEPRDLPPRQAAVFSAVLLHGMTFKQLARLRQPLAACGVSLHLIDLALHASTRPRVRIGLIDQTRAADPQKEAYAFRWHCFAASRRARTRRLVAAARDVGIL